MARSTMPPALESDCSLFSSLPLAGCPTGSSVADILSDVKLPELSTASGDFVSPVRDIFAKEKRKGWDKSMEARCDFEFHPRITPRAGIWFLSIWQKSLKGRTLTDIKADPEEITHFAVAVSDFIRSVMGDNLAAGDWAVITTPKRRHKVRNFASLICTEIHNLLQIPFVEDVALCRTKTRINAKFDLNILPEQHNFIVFDDFVTTGSTLRSMYNLLSPLKKNLLFVAGINNKL